MRRLLLLAFLAAPPAAWAASPNAIMGLWLTQQHEGVVRLYPCPSGVCGRLVGVTGHGPDGGPPRDWRGELNCQLEIIRGGRPRPDGVWDSHILNPDNGREYDITLQVDPDGRLRMRGYVLLPLFGSTIYWTPFHGRVTPDCQIGD